MCRGDVRRVFAEECREPVGEERLVAERPEIAQAVLVSQHFRFLIQALLNRAELVADAAA